MWTYSNGQKYLEKYFEDKKIKEIVGNPAYSHIIALTNDGVVHQRNSR